LISLSLSSWFFSFFSFNVGLCCVITISAESFFGWFAGAFHSLVDVLLSQVLSLFIAFWFFSYSLCHSASGFEF
jgi:hypothetical protein